MMRVIQRHANLPDDLGCLAQWQRPVLAEVVAQRQTFNVGHRNVRRLLPEQSGLTDLVNRHNMRVLELGCRIRLLEKARPIQRVKQDFGLRHFQRDLPRRHGLTGQIDNAHPAFAQLLHKLVLP